MIRVRTLLSLMAAGILSNAALGQNSFTFQGQLKQQGVPVSSEVDLQFYLYDSDTSKTSLAGPIVFDGVTNLPAVQVVGGLFSVELDFGADALQQGGQWLEIHVRSPHDPSGAGAYTPLLPRQHITAAPFALSVPGLAMNAEGVEVEGDVHAVGEVIASAFSSNSPLIFKVNPSDTECARFDDANCNLGLGTTTPLAKLDIAAQGEGAELLRFSTERPWSFRQSRTGSVTGLELRSSSGLKFFEINAPSGANVAAFLADDANPRVGLGTLNPLAKLDITGSGDGLELLRFSTERPWTFRQIRTGPVTGLQLLATSGQKQFEITANDGSNIATFHGNTTASKVGIGTINPARRLHVVEPSIFVSRLEGSHTNAAVTEIRSAASNTIWEQSVTGSTPPFGLGAGDYYVYRQGSPEPGLTISNNNFTASLRCADLRMGHSTRRGSPGRALVDNGTHLVINFANDWGYTYVNGRLKTNVLEVLGADLAEKFPSSESKVEPGTVMEIDPQRPGELRIAREAYSTRVAGVVSGAGELPAGAVLGNLPGHEDAPAIALSGRVWVKCDAGAESIAPGDLLTTSTTAGHAMKASARDLSHGAILGKAMTSLARGETGLVLVLVNLQ